MGFQLKVPSASTPSCQIALLPIFALGGQQSWDTARYRTILAPGQLIRHHCVEALGIPGLQGSGGMEAAGIRQCLRAPTIHVPLANPGPKATTNDSP